LDPADESNDYPIQYYMSRQGSLCFLSLALLIACNTKPTADHELPAQDSVHSSPQHEQILDLDVEQYQVYEDGDPTVTLPETDFMGPPRDREPGNLQQVSNVTRNGDELVFILKNGQQKLLKSNLTDEDNTVEYTFMRSIDTIGFWEVLAFYYESFDYILINQTDGTETHVWNKAVVSPDHKHILCGSTDLEAGFVANGFQLWSIKNGQLVLTWEKELNDWGAEKLIWATDNDVWGEQTFRDAVSGELKQRLIKMRMFWRERE
jgi:hypothetical protein